MLACEGAFLYKETKEPVISGSSNLAAELVSDMSQDSLYLILCSALEQQVQAELCLGCSVRVSVFHRVQMNMTASSYARLCTRGANVIFIGSWQNCLKVLGVWHKEVEPNVNSVTRNCKDSVQQCSQKNNTHDFLRKFCVSWWEIRNTQRAWGQISTTEQQLGDGNECVFEGSEGEAVARKRPFTL